MREGVSQLHKDAVLAGRNQVLRRSDGAAVKASGQMQRSRFRPEDREGRAAQVSLELTLGFTPLF